MDDLEFTDVVPDASPVIVIRADTDVVIWLLTEDRDLSLPYRVRVGQAYPLSDEHRKALEEALAAAGGLRGLLVSPADRPTQL